MSFEIGQEVICVKKGLWETVAKGRDPLPATDPKYGKLYVVSMMHEYNDGVYLELVGFYGTAYNSKYFIPKTDISAIEVLDEVQQITLPNLEELILID